MKESVYVISLAKLREFLFSQRYYKRISLLFGGGEGTCLSNRFKITGFKFSNVEKCLKSGDFFLKWPNNLACVRLLESTGTAWLVKTQRYLWCIKGQDANQSRDFVYNRES